VLEEAVERARVSKLKTSGAPAREAQSRR
jgi:hypothetical protein